MFTEKQLNYFMADEVFSRILSPEFSLTHQDSLRLRSRTTSTIESEIIFRDTKFKIVDTAGRSRRQWISQFEKSQMLIFVVSLEHIEMASDKRMKSSLEENVLCFEELCLCPLLSECDFTLILNKTDTFEFKKAEPTFEKAFRLTESCKGELETIESSLRFMEKQFMQLHGSIQMRQGTSFTVISISAIDTNSTASHLERILRYTAL